jgi:lipoprotein-anchoring transpeptidase ErfK/SrfK
VPFDTSIARMPPPLVALTQLGATSMPLMRRRQRMNAAPTPRCKRHRRAGEWPDWTPPAQMLHRRPDLPRHMAGGIDNPLGARAMYLGSSLYRIHGSNEPDSIGQATSSGCIRLTNEDVIDLYSRVRIGTPVIVQ